MQTSGYILVDKPKSWTSFDVVAKLRSGLSATRRQEHTTQRYCDPAGQPSDNHVCKCKRYKVGHSGTLDPMATGLLLVAYGSSTKTLNDLIKKDKIYEVQLKFGAFSDTGDAEGVIEEVAGLPEPSYDQVNQAVEKFDGQIMQTPPIYSAIKVDGKRAYDLARAGEDVKLEPRPVHIYSLSNVVYDYPYLKLTAHVGSGTYIRSLVVDIAESLGQKAYMADLRRTKIGDFSIDQAHTVEEAVAKLAKL